MQHVETSQPMTKTAGNKETNCNKETQAKHLVISKIKPNKINSQNEIGKKKQEKLEMAQKEIKQKRCQS